MRSLTDRQAEVLKAVIHEHVDSAEPVGSRTVARQYLTEISPATIRNTMLDLAEMGLLSQPHTSAGREPTVEGYRLYISSLMVPPRLARRDRTVLNQLLRERAAARDENAILDYIAQALAQVSHLLSVAFLPHFERGVLERIDLVPLAESRLLVVLQLENGPVDTVTLTMREPIRRDLLSETTQALNERLSGLSIGEIRRTVSTRLRDVSGGDREVMDVFVREGENIFNIDSRTGVHLEGRINILNQPEFADHARLTELLEALDDQPLIDELRQRSNPDRVEVSIGCENRISALSTCSLLTRGYHVGQLSGTLAIVGPMRMPYGRLVAALEHAGNVAEELLS